MALKSSEFNLVEGDICAYEIVERAMFGTGVDAVIHLAARAGVRPSILNPQPYYQGIVSGHPIFWRLASGMECPRWSLPVPPACTVKMACPHEEMRVDRPVSPYAATKQAGEGLVYSFHENHGLRRPVCVSLRCMAPATTRNGHPQIPECRTSWRAGHSLRDGSTSRDYTYVHDGRNCASPRETLCIPHL